MKKSTLILFILGAVLLIVGSALAAGPHLPVTNTISNSGTVVDPNKAPNEAPDESQSEQADQGTPLDKIGLATILLSAGLISAGIVVNKRRN